MKKTKLFVAALAALTMFACSKSEVGDTTAEGTKSVKVKVVTPPLTKAEKDPVTVGLKTTVNDITVFFLNAADQVVSGGSSITPTQAAAGYQFTAVNSSASQVYVVANVNPNVDISSIIVGSSLSDIEALEGNISTQMGGVADLIGVDNVVLSGKSTAQFTEVVPNLEYTTIVNIKPAVCRLELTSISSKPIDLVYTTGIASFDLTDIYINNYYPKFTVGGSVAGTQVGLIETVAGLSAVQPSMHDVLTGLTGQSSYNPDPKVMAYMLPVSTVNPRVIFQLANVTMTNTNVLEPDPKFVTVTNFYLAGTQTPITLERGKVYTVSNVEFTAVDDKPNDKNIKVSVTVTVSEWEIVLADPVI